MSGRTSCGCCVSFWCLFPALPKLPCGPLVCFVCKTDEWYILDLWIKDYGQRLRMRAKLMGSINTSQNTQSVKHNASEPGSFLTNLCLQGLDVAVNVGAGAWNSVESKRRLLGLRKLKLQTTLVYCFMYLEEGISESSFADWSSHIIHDILLQ